MPALFLGSIGVLAETSHLQLQSFNDAFAEAGLDWQWTVAGYRDRLKSAGGRDRIAQYAESVGRTDVDADALHRRKGEFFRERLSGGVDLRPGVLAAMDDARARGWLVAFVSTTSAANVAAVLDATGLSSDAFDLVLDRDAGIAAKPAPAVYSAALDRLALTPAQSLAVEDNPDGMRAAVAAGIRCLAVPVALHDAQDFDGADRILDTLRLPRDATAA